MVGSSVYRDVATKAEGPDELPPKPALTALRGFLSYAREDRTLARELHALLAPLEAEHGFLLWSDWELTAGVEWEDEVLARLADADVVLLLLTRAFHRSDFIKRSELPVALAQAAAGRSTVIPILVDDPLPRELVHLQGIDLRARTAAGATGVSPLDDGVRDVIERALVERRVGGVLVALTAVGREEIPDGILAGAIRRAWRTVPWLDEIVRARRWCLLPPEPVAPAWLHARLAEACVNRVREAWAEAPAYARSHLVSHAIAANDERLWAEVAALLGTSTFLALWMESRGDRDEVWQQLYEVHRRARDQTTRDQLRDLLDFFAHYNTALTPRPQDPSSVLARWLARSGRSVQGLDLSAAHLPVERAHYATPSTRDASAPSILAFGSVMSRASANEVLVSGQASLHRFDGRTWTWKRSLRATTGEGSCMTSVSPAGDRYLFTVNTLHQIRDVETDAPLLTLKDVGGIATVVDVVHWSPDGRFLYARCSSSLWKWSATTGEVLAHARRPEFYLRHQAPLGRWILALTNARDAADGRECLVCIDAETLTPARPGEPVAPGALDVTSTVVPVPSCGGACLVTDGALLWWDLRREEITVRRPWPFRPYPLNNRPVNVPCVLTSDESVLWVMTADRELQAISLPGLDVIGSVLVGGDDDRESGEFESIALSPSAGEVLLKLRNAVWSVSTKGALRGSRRTRVRPTLRWEGARIEDFPNCVLDASGCFAVHRNGLVLDLDRLASYLPLQGKVLARGVHTEADGDLMMATVGEDQRVRVWRASHRRPFAISEPLDLLSHQRVNAVATDGRLVWLVSQPSDDQVTTLTALGVSEGRLSGPWTGQIQCGGCLRHVHHLTTLGDGLLLRSSKTDALYFLPDALAVVKGAKSATASIREVDLDERARNWEEFLAGDDPRVVYGFNRDRREIAEFRLESGEVVRRTLCRGIQVTAWHRSGRYLCVTSNFLSAVYLVDRTSGVARLVVSMPDVVLASAHGPDGRSVEVFTAGGVDRGLPWLYERQRVDSLGGPG